MKHICDCCGNVLGDDKRLYKLELTRARDFDDGREHYPVYFEYSVFCSRKCAVEFYQEAFLDAKAVERRVY